MGVKSHEGRGVGARQERKCLRETFRGEREREGTYKSHRSQRQRVRERAKEKVRARGR